MVMLDGSKEDCLMLVCARLREVARAGAPTRARLALLGDALAALATKLLKVLGLDLLVRWVVRRLAHRDRGEDAQEVRVHVRVAD